MKFTDEDLKQLQEVGITVEQLEQQLSRFEKGVIPAQLVRAATRSDGIVVFDVHRIDELLAAYDERISKHHVVKFVPASGAASRMFKILYEFCEKYTSTKDLDVLLSEKDTQSLAYFFENIRKFAFFDELQAVMKKQQLDLEKSLLEKDYRSIVEFLLSEKGLNYGQLPKALILFHQYPDRSRTALGEHLVEGAGYGAVNGWVNLHFTVSPEHLENFEQRIADVLSSYEEKYQVKYRITYSIQKTSTDTIAVDENNQPIRDERGRLLFRQGGHGALIRNLEDLQGDLVFIKNIDNVTVDRLKIPTFTYKKVIGSYLVELQDKLFEYLKILEDTAISEEKLIEIYTFAVDVLHIQFDKFRKFSKEEKRLQLFAKLNRPIRICGMVKNEGEPGGGPFWVKHENGDVSLQIVESAQIDMTDLMQKNIAKHASHFNPVDLVCGLRNYRGELFDLNRYIDHESGLITTKSVQGKMIKALELPGLWNGGMADWITIFVELPIAVFTPVKTVNDLLRKEHQQQL